MKKFRYIELELENHGLIRFEKKDVKDIHLSDNSISLTVSREANDISKYTICGYPYPEGEDLFERMMTVPNIQTINLCKNDKEVKVFSVPYDGESLFRNGENSFQKSYVDDMGNLVIDIRERE